MSEFYKTAIEKFGREAQMIVAIEELSELQKELTKALRNKAKISAIIEEMADVYIMLEQLFWIFDIQDREVKEMIDEKNARLADLLELRNERI